MKRGGELGTIVLVTVVTILIWLLSAAKTREVATLTARITFTVAGDAAIDRFEVAPAQIAVNVTVEGGALAVRAAGEALRSAPLELQLPAKAGRQDIEGLAMQLQDLGVVRNAGVSVISVDPANVSVDVTEFVVRTVVIRAEIETASTVQDVAVAPNTAKMTLPKTVAQDLPDTLEVEAVVDPRDVARLDPGVLHTVEGTLRPIGLPPDAGVVAIEPRTARVSFQLVARMRQAIVPRVRVQVVSAPEDFGHYNVQVMTPLLESVEIEASPADVARIESGQAQVVAVLHLSTNDKEKGIQSKPVSFFAVIGPNGEATPIQGTIKGNSNPDIKLQITKVATPG
jgi:hypothetical protein